MPLVFYMILLTGVAVALVFALLRLIRSARKRKLAEAGLSSGERARAISHLKDILAEDPADLPSLLRLARLQLEAGQTGEAIRNARALLERNLSGSGVTQIDALIVTARAEEAIGNRQEALTLLKTAYGLDNTHPHVNLELAREHYHAGNWKEAFAYADRSARLEPLVAESHFIRGMAAFQSGSLELAALALGKTVELDSNWFEAAYTLARIYARQGQTDQARSVFRQAVQIAPGDDEKGRVYHQLALLYKLQNKGDEALAACNKVLQLKTDREIRSLALEEMITILEVRQDVPQLTKVLDELLRLNPDDAATRGKLAKYRELQQNTRLQNFELLPPVAFSDLCRRLCSAIVNVDSIQQSLINDDGSVDVVASRITKRKNSNYQFRFARGQGEIGEMYVRDLYDKMKRNGCERAFFICNSDFTGGAREFAATRVIDLVDKDGLLQYLGKTPTA